MKAEIAAAKELTAQGRLDEAMALANEKKPRGEANRNNGRRDPLIPAAALCKFISESRHGY